MVVAPSWFILSFVQAQFNLLNLGDGTEDISCRMDTTNWTVEDFLYFGYLFFPMYDLIQCYSGKKIKDQNCF